MGLKKFDAVIVNPLWKETDKFRLLSESLTKQYVSMITGAKHLSLDFSSKWNKISEYKYLGPKVFPTVNDIVAIFVLINIQKEDKKLQIFCNNGQSTIIMPLKFMPADDIDEFEWAMNIINMDLRTYKAYRSELYESDAIKDEKGIATIFYVGYKDKGYGLNKKISQIQHHHLKGHGKHKAIVSKRTDYKKIGVIKYAGPEWAIGNGIYFLIEDNKEEIDKLIAYFELPKMKRFIEATKNITKMNSMKVWNIIPHHSESSKW